MNSKPFSELEKDWKEFAEIVTYHLFIKYVLGGNDDWKKRIHPK